MSSWLARAAHRIARAHSRTDDMNRPSARTRELMIIGALWMTIVGVVAATALLR
jgi:hypothetical protein